MSPLVQRVVWTLGMAGVIILGMVAAAAPVLKVIAEDRGFTRLAVFGSVARRPSPVGPPDPIPTST